MNNFPSQFDVKVANTSDNRWPFTMATIPRAWHAAANQIGAMTPTSNVEAQRFRLQTTAAWSKAETLV